MDLLHKSDFLKLGSKGFYRILKFGKMLPITSEIAVEIQLDRDKIPSIDERFFSKTNDIIKNRNSANILTNTWWESPGVSIKFKNFNLFMAAQQELVSPFEAELNAKIVSEYLVNCEEIENIYGYYFHPIGVVRTRPVPANRAVTSVAQAILFWMTGRNGMPINHLKPACRLSVGTKSKRISQGIGQTVIRVDGHSFDNNLILVLKDGMPDIEYTKICDYFENRLH